MSLFSQESRCDLSQESCLHQMFCRVMRQTKGEILAHVFRFNSTFKVQGGACFGSNADACFINMLSQALAANPLLLCIFNRSPDIHASVHADGIDDTTLKPIRLQLLQGLGVLCGVSPMNLLTFVGVEAFFQLVLNFWNQCIATCAKKIWEITPLSSVLKSHNLELSNNHIFFHGKLYVPIDRELKVNYSDQMRFQICCITRNGLEIFQFQTCKHRNKSHKLVDPLLSASKSKRAQIAECVKVALLCVHCRPDPTCQMLWRCSAASGMGNHHQPTAVTE